MNTIIDFPESAESRQDPWNSFVQLGPHLIDRARAAAERAKQYRGFRVGAVALAVNDIGSLGIFEGVNYKPYKYGPKECAEKAALREVKRYHFDRVVALIVSGPPQPDRHSGIELPTLPPCGDCRTLLYNSSLIRDDTMILSVPLDQDSFELYMRKEIGVIHDSVDDDDAPSAFSYYDDPGFAIWGNAQTRYVGLQLVNEKAGDASVPPHVLARLAVTGAMVLPYNT